MNEEQRTEIEQQLKQLQPLPVKLDVQDLWQAALEAEQAVALADRGQRGEISRLSGWVKIGTSWVCGVVVGALLAFLLLRRDVASEAPSLKTEGLSKTTIATGNEASDESIASGGTVRQNEGERTLRDDAQEEAVPWSHSELLVSTRARDLYRLSLASFRETRLQAGHHLRFHGMSSLQSLRVSNAANSGEETAAAIERVPGGEEALPASQLDQARPLDRKRLLQELLGMDPKSLL